MALLQVLAVLIAAAGVVVICVRVSGLGSQIEQLTKQLADEQAARRAAESVHDTAHPAFSVAQLALARHRFETEYKDQLRLEAKLYGSDEWRARPKGKAPLSSSVSAEMREICEAVVQCESAWQEYLWMVDSNLSVASGRETRSAIHKSYKTLYPRTPQVALYSNISEAPPRVQRIEKLLSSWVARLGGDEGVVEIDGPDFDAEVFDFRAEIRNKNAALLNN